HGLMRLHAPRRERPSGGARDLRIEPAIGEIVHRATRRAHHEYAHGKNDQVFPWRKSVRRQPQRPPSRPQQQQRADRAIHPHQHQQIAGLVAPAERQRVQQQFDRAGRARRRVGRTRGVWRRRGRQVSRAQVEQRQFGLHRRLGRRPRGFGRSAFAGHASANAHLDSMSDCRAARGGLKPAAGIDGTAKLGLRRYARPNLWSPSSAMSLIQQLTRHKSVEQLQAEAGGSRDFRRVLGVWQLTAIGIGAIIGVGIFVLAGQQAAINAGPAVIVSFLVAGIGSACAALAYAEFSGMIPVTGSAYTYGYAVLGELLAWIIGWDLLLEYALIVAVVAIGWSGYVQALIAQLTGAHLPVWLQGAYDPAHPDSGKFFNVIAAVITLLIAWVLTVRTEVGARLNTIIVAIKVTGVALVIVVGAFYINTANWHPFIPAAVTENGATHYGWSGVLAASSIVFFACFGYDTLTTAAEEARNPQRDLPRAVLLSLGLSMALYLAVSLVLTGMVPYPQLN